jgi:hypothetical protein
MLLAGAADAPDPVQGRVLLLEPLQDQVDGLEPQGHGSKDLTLLFIGQNTLLDAVLGAEVLVEVDFGVGDDLEVGLDDDGWAEVALVGGFVRLKSAGLRTLELLGREVESQVEGSVTHCVRT